MSRQPVSPPVEGAVSAAKALHFATVAHAFLHAPLPPTGLSPHIGTLREKRLHAAIKAYLCPDTTCHERPVEDGLAKATDAPSSVDRKRRLMIADILTDGTIFEVQTGGFAPLKDKVAWYLTHTPYCVTVVHPIPAVRYLSWIDPADGTVISRRRSPKRGRVRDVARELYYLSDCIGNPRVSVRLLLLELEEYRLADGWSHDGKRGSNRYERFPTALLGDVTLTTPADYAAFFLPDAWTNSVRDTPFTAADYARATGIRGRATYGMLRLLVQLGLVTVTEEKLGRSRGYRIIEGSIVR